MLLHGGLSNIVSWDFNFATQGWNIFFSASYCLDKQGYIQILVLLVNFVVLEEERRGKCVKEEM